MFQLGLIKNEVVIYSIYTNTLLQLGYSKWNVKAEIVSTTVSTYLSMQITRISGETQHYYQLNILSLSKQTQRSHRSVENDRYQLGSWMFPDTSTNISCTLLIWWNCNCSQTILQSFRAKFVTFILISSLLLTHDRNKTLHLSSDNKISQKNHPYIDSKTRHS